MFCSLGEVFEGERHAKGLDPDAPVMLCRERCSAAISRAKNDLAAETQAAMAAHAQQVQAVQAAIATAVEGAPVPAAPPPPIPPSPVDVNKKVEEYVRREKLEVFHEVSAGMVPKTILMQFVHTTLGGEPEQIWAWQHAFAAQLGVSSLLCFALSCGDRAPGKLVFHKQHARVLSADLRPGYGLKGYMENNEEVPFRLSPNLMAILTPFLVDGVFVPTMAAVAHAMTHKREYIQPFLHLMLRDDILSWHASKSPQPTRSESDQKQLERAMAERVNRNVLKVLERLQYCAPMLPSDKFPFHSPLHPPMHAGGATAQAVMVDVKATALVERAAKPEHIAQMSPTWQPWL